MSEVEFKVRHQKRWQTWLLVVTVVVFLVLALVGCGADDGGVPDNDSERDTNHTNETVYEGVDKKEVETFDYNAEVMSVTVDGVKCILAVRDGGPESLALACDFE